MKDFISAIIHHSSGIRLFTQPGHIALCHIWLSFIINGELKRTINIESKAVNIQCYVGSIRKLTALTSTNLVWPFSGLKHNAVRPVDIRILNDNNSRYQKSDQYI
jgi:hypothetical protein